MTTFSAVEAVPLAHALVQRIAEDAGIRVLSIKGPVAALHGLRPERVYADADLLVEPGKLDQLVAALVALDWYAQVTTDAPQLPALHSVTCNHAQWPCDLDLHWYFPGLLAPEGDVFEALWEERVETRVADSAVSATGRYGSILIGILHSLRGSGYRSERELTLLHDVLCELDVPETARLVDLATRTGSLEPTRAVLAGAGLHLPDPPSQESPELALWQLRMTDASTRTTGWVLALTRAPWHRKPALLARAIFPEEVGFRAEYRTIEPGWVALNRARLGRLARGIPRLPAAIRNVWAARNRVP